MTGMSNMIVLADGDNVGIALVAIVAGTAATGRGGMTVTAGDDIPQGHKIALTSIAEAERIIRFSVPVGIATREIPCGALVHVHNVQSQYLDNDVDHYE